MPAAIALAWALFAMALAVVFARWVESRPEAQSRWLAHPLTYTLVLGTYFTGWAFYGDGAALFGAGIGYLSHVIGWSFLFMFGWPLVLKAVRFARAHGVTTLPGYFTVRYGASPWLSGLLVAILVLAMLPYLTVQLEAIAFSLQTVITAQAPQTDGVGLFVPLWALLVTVFAVLFGGRQPDPTRRLPGLFATLAVGGMFKLVVVLVVAAFAIRRFGGALVLPAAQWPTMNLAASPETSYLVWAAYMGVSVAGVLLLPHMFHLGVVEARADAQVKTSRWSFPLYGWIFEVAVLPITLAGVLLGLRGTALQGAVLLVPDAGWLRMTAFLGGLAAASGMAAVTLIALANTLLLDAVLPLVGSRIRRVGGMLVPLRACLIAFLALCATALWALGERQMLFQVGLLAFVAVAQIAPGFFGGLVWPHLKGRAIGWGLALASVVWLYTAMVPSLALGVPAIAAWVAQGPWGLGFLRPHALLGLEGLPPAVHALFWCSLANLLGVWVTTARHPATAAEVVRARTLMVGEAAPHDGRPLDASVDWARIDGLLTSFLGPERGREELAGVQAAFAIEPTAPEAKVLAARDALERVLRGPLGPVVAREVVEHEIPVTRPLLHEVMAAYRQLEQLLALSQDELAERIQELTRLKESLEARVEARTQDLASERDRLKAAIDDLRNLERLKTAFVNAVSHDLRIPLTGIMGYAEFLEEEMSGELNDAQKDYVRNIMDATRRMTGLLNEMLDYARLEAGKFTVEPRPVELPSIIEQSASTFYPIFDRKRLTYTVELPEFLPEVHADPDRMIQVLSNLLSNAAKFTPDGGTIAVRARLVPDLSLARVEVADTGVGISAEDMPHLFERFYQTKAGEAAGGTGLGLSISKSLVEAQGGQMGATSRPGEGTTIWFTIPLANLDD